MNIEQIKHRIGNIAIMCDENDKEQLDILAELLALINDINIESIETVKDVPSAEKTDSFIPQEDVAGILNTVESALKGTNYEVVGYDNTDGFLKVLIDVK